MELLNLILTLKLLNMELIVNDVADFAFRIQ